MDNEQVLKIVLKAQDEASAAFRKAAEEVDKLQKTIKDGTDKASDSLEKAGKSASYFKDHIQDIGIAATGILGTIGALTRSMVDVAATMEQNRIAFTTMTGSAELAGKTLKQLSDFAATTPFELPQLVEGSKKLLAYNIEAKNIIPTMKMLGDISAGVGMDKLPNLILAFGQVKAATHLTGMELRQFSEAGVPLLDALVKQANAAGGAWVTVGKSAKKSKVDVAEVTEKIGILNQKMAENHEKYKEGSVAYRQAQLQLKGLNDKLSEAGSAGTTTGKVWQKMTVTANDMIEKISAGEVTFDQVQKALSGMTEKGGKFFDLMKQQSGSFSGIMSNLQDNLTRLSMQIVGMSESGEIRQGSIFYYVKEGAQKLLVVMDDLRPKLVRFADDMLRNKTVVIAVAGALGGLTVAAMAAAVAFAGPALAGAAAFAAAGAAIAFMIQDVTTHLREMTPMLAVLGTTLTILSLTNPFTALITGTGILAAGFYYLSTQTDFLKTKNDLLKDSNDRLTQAQDRLKGSTDGLTDAQARLKDMQVQLSGAALMVENAQSNLDRTQKIYGQNSYEVRQARQLLAEAELNAERTMRETTKAMQEADKAKETFIKNSKEVAKAQDDVTEKTKLQASAWDSVVNAISGAIGKLNEWNNNIKKATGGIGATFPGYHLPGFAEGTNFAPGGWSVVGERGPELVNLPRGSQVIPNNRTEQYFNGGNVNIAAVYVSSEGDIQTLAQQLAYYRKTRGNL